ncbi:MAG: glycosyltransferase family 2 protein [Gemmataceae bacterium]
MVDVSVCIANWNCRDYLRACLESLLRSAREVRLEVIVVDNASTDGAAEMVARDFPDVVLLRNAENVGFSRANNQAARRARGRYLFFLNNDTVVPPGALRQLVAYADAHPDVGMIGPRLRDAQGRVQISHRPRPTVAALLHRTLLLRWLGLWRGAYQSYRRPFDSNIARRVEVLMGAAVLLPRRVFHACGGWDETFTFGGEDIDLSERVNRTHAVLYLPSVEITHHGRVSTRQNAGFTAAHIAVGFARNLRQAGARWWELLLYKWIVTLDAPTQIVCRWIQYHHRRRQGRLEQAAKSWRVVQGQWHFLSRGLRTFWRA